MFPLAARQPTLHSKYRGSGTRGGLGGTGHWSCGQQNTNNHHSHRLMMMGLQREKIITYCRSIRKSFDILEATVIFFLWFYAITRILSIPIGLCGDL